jgi:aminopeptidase N
VEFLVAHEVAHQWWYGLVGNNQYQHAFLDEGLAEYASFLYYEREHGAEAVERHVNLGLRLRYATMVFTDGDTIVDQPSGAFPDEGTYAATVYWKAALGFSALRDEVGDTAFFAGLRDYAARKRFQIAVPADVRGAFERAAGRELDGFWRSWFEAPEGHVRLVVESGRRTSSVATPVRPLFSRWAGWDDDRP